MFVMKGKKRHSCKGEGEDRLITPRRRRRARAEREAERQRQERRHWSRSQVNDRFQRLEALVASYHTSDVEVPTSLQVWTEGQLRVLVPYLNGGNPRVSGTGDGYRRHANQRCKNIPGNIFDRRSAHGGHLGGQSA